MKKEKDLISIIVPVYNVEKYITQCITSIIEQTYKNIEIIAINDGSIDNSLEALEKLKLQDDRIKIITQDNKGVSCARNEGLKVSKGKYIIFVDADDYISNEFVNYMHSLISKDNCDFAFSLNNYWEKNEKQETNIYEKTINSNIAVGLLLSPDVTVGCWNKIYKKSFLSNNNITFRGDLYYGEGLNFIIRTALATNKICVGNKKVYYYRKNNVMSATSKFSFNKYINGEKSLLIIKDIIDLDDDFVKSMYLLHISTFYVGAVASLIENKCTKKYLNYYTSWKKKIKNNLPYIVSSKYITFYRKSVIVAGFIAPHLISKLNSWKKRKNICKSVN